MDELAPRSPGVLTSIRSWVARSLGVGLPVYSSSGGGVPASPSYPAEMAMAALVANPWVWACAHAIVTDLCGLPLVAETGTGINRTQTYDDPTLQLLARPSPKVSGVRFRRQLVLDSVFGNAYSRVWWKAGRPVMLGRIPPGLIEAQVGEDGEELGWTLPATGRTLTWDEVLHVADPSWEHTQALVFGDSPIQPLALGLSVDRDTRKQSGRAARRGRLEMMLAPEGAEVLIGKTSTREMTDQYVTAATEGHGVYVVNKAMKATPLTLTAREGEFLGITDRLRAEILAVFGVPPVRAGEPAANYGTAKQQMRTYWETLQGRAALIDDELSRLAGPGVRIRHSFANVEALQTSRTERQARAVIWMQAFGMSPPKAAAYEDFGDAPVAEVAPAAKPAAGQIPTADPTVDEPAEDKSAMVGATLVLLASMFETSDDPQPMARGMLRASLIALGATPATADTVSAEAVSLCHEAAQLATEPLVDLRAFGPDHAQRIARLAGVAA